MERYTNAILNSTGRPVVGAVISVSTYPERMPATIYDSLGGAAVSSVKSDRQGNFGFYAPNGSYSLTITAPGIATQVLDDIEIYDPTDDIFREQALQKAAEAEQRASALLSQVGQAQIVVQQTTSQAADARDRAVTAAEEAKLSSSTATYLTYAAMAADTSRPVNTQGRVTNDGDSAKNGYYVWNGATWILSGIQPASAIALAATKIDASAARNAVSVRKRPRGPKSGNAAFLASVGGSVVHLPTIRKRPRSQAFPSAVVTAFGSSIVGQFQNVDDNVRLGQLEAGAVTLTANVAELATKVAGASGQGQTPPADWIAEAATVGAETQIMIHDGTSQRQLTPAGSNWRAPMVRPFNVVRCLGDKGGALARYDIAPNGLVMKDDKLLFQKVITGQSLSLGSRGYVLNPQGKYEFESGVFGDLFTESVPVEMQAYCLSLAGGPRPMSWAGTTNFIPIREYASGVTGESIASSWAIAFKRWANQSLACTPRFLVSISGVGATAYAGLKKGTTTYSNALSHVTTARNIALSKGWDHVVSSVSFIHGESQTGTTQAQYAAMLAEWISDYRADIVAITGQAVPPMGFLSQTHTGEAGVLPAITLAQVDAHNANAGLCLVGPKYAYPYFDFYHMLAAGYVKMGEIEQRAERFWLAGKKWQPLMPISAVMTGPATLTITYNNAIYGNDYTAGPIGRLVLDTKTITDPGNCGFEIAGVSITSVTLGANGTSVVLGLSSTPGAGTTVDYAIQASLNYPANGRRGNVRDSDTRDKSRFDGAFLYNWSIAHRTPITF